MGSAQASPPAAPESATPVEALDCRLGLVLSGGGARGFAHIGVLRELERHRVRIDCIAGTSVGAVIGALYASGHSSQAIETILRSMSFDSVYSDPHDRQLYPLAHRLRQRRVLLTLGLEASRVRFPKAILSDYLINRKLIQSLTAANFEAGREFSRLPIPFRAVSTDLRTGDRIILERGDLGRSVRGSMSVPLAYSPVELGETLLVDGGIVDNIPVDVARLMGAEFIIAVDVTTPVERGVSADVLGVSKQIIDLLYAVKNRSFEAEPDLLIKPDLERHGFSDYSDLDALIRLGADEAAAQIRQVPERYLGSRRAPDGMAAHDPKPRLAELTLTAVRVVGNQYLQPNIIVSEFDLSTGEPFDLDDALEGMDRLFSAGSCNTCGSISCRMVTPV